MRGIAVDVCVYVCDTDVSDSCFSFTLLRFFFHNLLLSCSFSMCSLFSNCITHADMASASHVGCFSIFVSRPLCSALSHSTIVPFHLAEGSKGMTRAESDNPIVLGPHNFKQSIQETSKQQQIQHSSTTVLSDQKHFLG